MYFCSLLIEQKYIRVHHLQDDFIALELVDRKVRFVWNVGGGTGILTHPEIIHSSDIQDDKFWYRIEAER